MRAYSLLLVFAFLLAYVSPLTALSQTSNPYEPQIAEFEAFTKRRMATDNVPGLSVGFIKDGFMWTKGFGFADLENQTPAKAESMYRMTSVTKPMTAVAVLQLAKKAN